MEISRSTKDALRTAWYNPFIAMKIRRGLLAFERGYRFDGNLASYISFYSRNQVDPSLYSFECVGGRGWTPEIEFIRDAIYMFVLSANGSKVACISFDIEEHRALTVKQIQGKKDMQEALAPLKWERMLLGIVLDWATQYGFRQVRVQRAEDNCYWNKFNPELNKRLKIRYDITARRNGFRLDKRGDYVRDL